MSKREAVIQLTKASEQVTEVAYVPARPPTRLLVNRTMPDSPVPTPAQALQAQRNVEARWALLEEFGAYSGTELGERRSHAKNRSALASRWRKEGRVFSVEVAHRQLFPGFQFEPETLAPLPVVARVLATLPRGTMSDWEVALWWTADNGWLEGRRPVDVMGEEPEVLAAAAAHLAEPSPL